MFCKVDFPYSMLWRIESFFFSLILLLQPNIYLFFAALFTTFYGKLFLPTVVILFLSCKCFEDYEWTTLNLKLCFSKSLFDWILALGLLLSRLIDHSNLCSIYVTLVDVCSFPRTLPLYPALPFFLFSINISN